MAVITLTSDWGLRDQHVAILKGKILRAIENPLLIDISHDVQPFNIAQAAYLFRNTYLNFPDGTIHFIGVGSFPSVTTEFVAIKKEGHSFVGMNDGFFSLVFDDQPVDMVQLTASEFPFAAYDVTAIVNAILHLSSGKNIYELGSRVTEFVQKSEFRPVIEEDVIRGSIIYIDDFGNAVTNIDRKLFEQIRDGRKFEINARRQQYTITTLSERYAVADRGNLVALFNISGYLEIAINQGNASTLLGLKNNDTIRIDFT
ncbi:MAG: SAM-dependent chlorinase/fluorinase [Bacteroidota bacterium]